MTDEQKIKHLNESINIDKNGKNTLNISLYNNKWRMGTMKKTIFNCIKTKNLFLERGVKKNE